MSKCPQCGSGEAYVRKAKRTGREGVYAGPQFICKDCKRHYTETSTGLWHGTKMPKDRREEIIRLLVAGNNVRQVSIHLRCEYKTVWMISKKIRAQPKWRRVDNRAPRRISGAEKANGKPSEQKQEARTP